MSSRPPRPPRSNSRLEACSTIAELLGTTGNIPPAEAEERYYAMLNEPAMAVIVTQTKTASDQPGAVQF